MPVSVRNRAVSCRNVWFSTELSFALGSCGFCRGMYPYGYLSDGRGVPTVTRHPRAISTPDRTSILRAWRLWVIHARIFRAPGSRGAGSPLSVRSGALGTMDLPRSLCIAVLAGAMYRSVRPGRHSGVSCTMRLSPAGLWVCSAGSFPAAVAQRARLRAQIDMTNSSDLLKPRYSTRCSTFFLPTRLRRWYAADCTCHGAHWARLVKDLMGASTACGGAGQAPANWDWHTVAGRVSRGQQLK